MAGRLILDACNPALDANGRVDADATLQFYENLTTTPQATYTGPDLAVAHDNPLECDSSGRFPEIWGPNGSVYSVEWQPTGEAAITLDNIALTADPNPVSDYFYVAWYKGAVLSDSETLFIFNVPSSCELPVDLNDGVIASLFTINTNPTATLTLTIKKNASSIGTIAFSTSGVPTITFANRVVFSATDQLIVTGPASHDVTGAFIALTFVFKVA